MRTLMKTTKVEKHTVYIFQLVSNNSLYYVYSFIDITDLTCTQYCFVLQSYFSKRIQKSHQPGSEVLDSKLICPLAQFLNHIPQFSLSWE